VPTSNPALSDKAFERAGVVPVDQQPGWAAPPPGTIPPAPDAVSPWRPATPTKVMTVNGSVTATGVLLVLLVAGAFVGWMSTTSSVAGVEIPAWIVAPALGAFGLAIATIFRPMWARVTAPLYAIGEGILVGAISKLYENQWNGVVSQAVVATVAVFAVMLFLYATHIVKVTDKLRMIVVGATCAVMLVYVFDLVMRLFDSSFPFLHDTGGMGILISGAIVVIAAMNLLLDFDFIDRGTAARAPKAMEWYAGFALVLHLVWLYLELLRLLSKLQRR
jgi:uncharacterized YccA/Bax inhibitor family protein